jgi:hypothetical protein
VLLSPLTAEQRSLLFLEGLFGPGIFHNIGFDVRVPTEVTRVTAAAAVQALVDRHDMLRSSPAGTSPFVQSIGEDTPDIAQVEAEGEDPLTVLALRRSELHNVRLSPMRAHFELIGSGSDPRRSLLCMLDHLVSDGQSAELLKKELTALLAGQNLASADGPFGHERGRRLDDGTYAKEVGYWQTSLAGIPPLSGFMPRSTDRSSYVRTQVDHETADGTPYDAVRELARTYRTIPFAIMAAVVAIAVWRRSEEQRGFLLHTPVSTRREAATKTVVGNFVVDRPIPCRVDPDEPLAELVEQIHNSTWQAIRHSRLSVPDLVCEAPEYGASLLGPGVDYLQLHVDVQADGAVAPNSGRPLGTTGPSVLGAFEPAHDVSVTTLRFQFSQTRLFTRTFFGGPPTGIGPAEELRRDVMAMLHVAGGFQGTTGGLADAIS